MAHYKAILEQATRKLNRQKKRNRLYERVSANNRNEDYYDDYDEAREHFMNLPAYERLEEFREMVGDGAIVDSLAAYMTTDQLDDFTIELIRQYIDN